MNVNENANAALEELTAGPSRTPQCDERCVSTQEQTVKELLRHVGSDRMWIPPGGRMTTAPII